MTTYIVKYHTFAKKEAREITLHLTALQREEITRKCEWGLLSLHPEVFAQHMKVTAGLALQRALLTNTALCSTDPKTSFAVTQLCLF